MNKILIGVVLIAVVAVIGFFISTMEAPDPLNADPVEVAKTWVEENVSTFTQRGGSNLEHVETLEKEEEYEVTFSFQSAFSGYGPVEEGEMNAQVITPHTVVVTVKEGEVASAVTDGEYDEVEMVFLEKEENVSHNVYFVLIEEEEEVLKPLERNVSPEETERAILLELLAGPTEEEKDEGYSTAISDGVVLNSFFIEDRVAYVDFSEELDASGSAMVTMIRNQIEETLLQFETVDDLVISIEGETEEVLQP